MKFSRPKKANWSFWSQRVSAELWEAVWLTMNLEPDQDAYITGHGDSDRLGQARVEIARDHLECGNGLSPVAGLKGSRSTVSLAEFAGWAADVVKWTIPPEFAALSQKQPSAPGQSAMKWPWGDHDTGLLRALKEAAIRFYGTERYVPGEIDSVSTNDLVAEWLHKEKKVASRVAKVMAQILRPDGIPRGRRPGK